MNYHMLINHCSSLEKICIGGLDLKECGWKEVSASFQSSLHSDRKAYSERKDQTLLQKVCSEDRQTFWDGWIWTQED